MVKNHFTQRLQDKLYEALSIKGLEADPATKEMLRYREALLAGYACRSGHLFLPSDAL